MIGSDVRVFSEARGPIDFSDELVLDSVLGIYTNASLKRTFKSDIFQKRPMVVRGNASIIEDIISNYLFDLNVHKILENTASELIHVWLRINEGDILFEIL